MLRRMIYHVKTLTIALVVIVTVIICPATTAYAISLPDDPPIVEDIYVWRNVLETADMLVILVENTPYGTTPTDYQYSEAFIWRFMNGATDLVQAVGYGFNDEGFGYNVISFYFDAGDAPAWSGVYTLKLSGSPSAFPTPPEYNYPINASSYSVLTDMDEVKADIADTIIDIATSFYNYWGLTATTTLIAETETATVLSTLGQSYFRGAIYGIQGMAPAAFAILIQGYDITDRTWTDAYVTTLEAQHAGNSIEAGFTAGEGLLDVGYNLMGLLISLAICGGLILANWILAGGQIWRCSMEAIPVLVIGARMSLVGLGELGLFAALCMLYVNARIWKII